MIDYNFLDELSISFEIEQSNIGGSIINSPKRVFLVPNKREMEDIIKSTNSVAEKVEVFYPKDASILESKEPYYLQVKQQVIAALNTLFDHLTDIDFLSTNIDIIQENSLNNTKNEIWILNYSETINDFDTNVQIKLTSDFLASYIIIPNKPGAIINNYFIHEFE